MAAASGGMYVPPAKQSLSRSKPTMVDEVFNPPREPPTEDRRWRPTRQQVEDDMTHQQRSEKAIADQCMNARVPGYKGYIPGVKAESIYGRTEAQKGAVAAEATARRRQQTLLAQSQGLEAAAAATAQDVGEPWAQVTRGDLHGGATIGAFTVDGPGSGVHERRDVDRQQGPSEHPLVASQSQMVRNHWVPTIPGYSGHVPGKIPEPVCGAGPIGTCRMAGRAIAERSFGPSPLPPEEEKSRLAEHQRQHCTGRIPGYTGHMPRIHGESIYGARGTAANLLAADYCEDRLFNPPPGNIQIPKKQLRI